MQNRKCTDQKIDTIELDPDIKVKHKGTKTCRHNKIKYTGCLLGEMKRRTDSSSTTTNLKEMTLQEGILYPGQLIYADQY